MKKIYSSIAMLAACGAVIAQVPTTQRAMFSTKKINPASETTLQSKALGQAYLISDFSMSSLLQEKLLNIKTNLLKEVFIFDYFINEDKEEIKIGFRFVFQSSKATITDEEVNSTMSKIIEETKLINGVTIPGVL